MNAEEKTAIAQYVTDMRRALHRIPELSEHEFRTSEFIMGQLKSMGYSFERIGTGIYVDIEGEDLGMRVALRCDMDGLPIKEKTDVDFKAEENMHACGHDGHMAIILGMAKLLKTHRPAVSVRLIFQFGEEGEGGADKMIAGGVLEGVDEIYAFHVCPELDKGKIASCEGAMFAGTVEFDVEVKGRSAHCADREKGADAVAVVSRILSGAEKLDKSRPHTLLHIGRIEAGSARNVVADKAVLNCTLRYFDKADAHAVIDELKKTLLSADGENGTESKIAVRAVYPPLVNSAYALKRLRDVARVATCKPRYTAEDFAFYTEKIDGCMAWLGVRDEKYSSPLHSDTFGFDESALMLGVETMFALVCGKRALVCGKRE